MEEKNIHISYRIGNVNELGAQLKSLADEAWKAMESSYAPYSQFNVGASLLLEDDSIILGSNLENASYPVGLCAERSALAAASSVSNGKKILAIAIVAKNSQNAIFPPVAPCGMCRQALLEAEMYHQQNIQVLLCGSNHEVFIFNSIKDLLPLHFDGNQL